MPTIPVPGGPDWYQELVEAWLRALRRRGRSVRTIRSYAWTLRDFGRWLDHCRVTEHAHLIPTVLYSWQDSLADRDWTLSSQDSAATSLRGLLRWGAKEGMGIPTGLWERVESVDVPESLPRALEPQHLAVILAHYARSGRELLQLRDRALFRFLLTTGSRISAALSVTKDQVAAGGRLVVVQKGGGEHLLVPSAGALEWISDYLRVRGRDDQPRLWIYVGPRGRHPLRAEQANAIWAELAAELRIPAFTSHALRHTAVTELGDRGASDTEIAKHVGWKNNAQALRYRQLRAARRQALVDQLDDLVPAVAAAAAAPARRRRPRVEVMVGKRRKR